MALDEMDGGCYNEKMYGEMFERGCKRMKENIHPKYYKARVTCACGETFESGSTRQEIRVELCSKCHPFFTGQQRLVDTGGQVEKFKKKFEKRAANRA